MAEGIAQAKGAASTIARSFVSASIGLAFGDSRVIHKKAETNLVGMLSLPPAPEQPSASELTTEQKEAVVALLDAVKQRGLSCDPGDAAVYLEMNEWGLDASLKEAIGDLEWEARETNVAAQQNTDQQKNSEQIALLEDHKKLE